MQELLWLAANPGSLRAIATAASESQSSSAYGSLSPDLRDEWSRLPYDDDQHEMEDLFGTNYLTGSTLKFSIWKSWTTIIGAASRNRAQNLARPEKRVFTLIRAVQPHPRYRRTDPSGDPLSSSVVRRLALLSSCAAYRSSGHHLLSPLLSHAAQVELTFTAWVLPMELSRINVSAVSLERVGLFGTGQGLLTLAEMLWGTSREEGDLNSPRFWLSPIDPPRKPSNPSSHRSFDSITWK